MLMCGYGVYALNCSSYRNQSSDFFSFFLIISDAHQRLLSCDAAHFAKSSNGDGFVQRYRGTNATSQLCFRSGFIWRHLKGAGSATRDLTSC